MSAPCIPCKALKKCLESADFIASNSTDLLYQSLGQNITATCVNGTQVTVPFSAGAVGFILDFVLGNPPYPNLVLNCTGGLISVAVPDGTNQTQLNALIQGMLNTCLTQIAIATACGNGVFFNTLQNFTNCSGANALVNTQTTDPVGGGGLPAGVSVPHGCGTLQMAAGTIQSEISVADANAKAQQVLKEIFSTGNAVCGNTCTSP